MMVRLLLVAAAFALAGGADARAEPRAQKAQKAQDGPPVHDRPLQVYLAKGQANACGEGCSEWIAVEGRFDRDAAGRVSAFLRRHAARKLPVYFDSPGGSGTAAIAIGRQLRKLGVTTGAGKTIPKGCAAASDRSNACGAAKRTAQAVAAEWRADANCSSACVWALIGGKVRHVPPSARLGVHSGKLTVTRKYSDGRVQTLTAKQVATAYKGRIAEIEGEARRYIREMGIDGALMEAALKVPHEKIHYLSRDEIAGYGIDRREFQETRWLVNETSSNRLFVSKWIVEARGSERKDYRVSVVFLSCSQTQRATIQYWRGVASGELAGPVITVFSIGGRKANLSLTGYPTKRDVIDTGGSFASITGSLPFAAFESIEAGSAVEIAESGPIVANKTPRVIKLATEGLADGIKILRDKCQPPVPNSIVDAAQVPLLPAQGAAENPWMPAGTSPPQKLK